MEIKANSSPFDRLPGELLTHVVNYLILEDAHHWSLASKRYLFLFEEKLKDRLAELAYERAKVQAKSPYRQYKRIHQYLLDGYAKFTVMVFLTSITVFSLLSIYCNYTYNAETRDPMLSSLRGHVWNVVKTIGIPMALLWINIAIFEETNIHSRVKRVVFIFNHNKVQKRYQNIFQSRSL